jgi:hypothetical protein
MWKKSLVILGGMSICLPLLSGQARAGAVLGQLAQIKGTAVISQGPMYVVGKEGMPLQAGNRLMTLEGGEALLWFSDQCQYRLSEDMILDLGAQSPCALGQGGEYRPDLQVAVARPADAPARFQPAAIGDADKGGNANNPVGGEGYAAEDGGGDCDDEDANADGGSGSDDDGGCGGGGGAAHGLGGTSLTTTTALTVVGLATIGAVVVLASGDDNDPQPLSADRLD